MGIVVNGSVPGKEFSANAFSELYPARTEEKQIAESKHDRLSQTANALAGIVNAVLDLADTQAQEEQQRIQKRRRRKKALLNCQI